MHEGTAPGKSSWAFYLALCLLGPFFFLSLIFSILAPLPTLYLHRGTSDSRLGKLWAYFALPLGALICAKVYGGIGSFAYIFLVSMPALMLGELLARQWKAESAVLLTSISVALVLVLGFMVYAKTQNQEPLAFFQAEMSQSIKEFSTKILESPEAKNPQSEAELRQIRDNPESLLLELPGYLFSAILLLILLPFLALARWNPKAFLRRSGLPRDFLRKWRSPEWLIWALIACVAFWIIEIKYVSAFTNNLLKPLILIYFFHGMSILAFFLDSLRLRGPLRVMIYSLGIFFLTPMVVSFGIFDLWLNFRSRYKSRAEGNEDEL